MGEKRNQIVASFEAQAMQKPKISNPAGHITLSFAAEDKPKLSDEKMLKIALDYIKMMGLDKTQWLIVRHYGVGMMRYLVEIGTELFQLMEERFLLIGQHADNLGVQRSLPYKFRPAHAGARCLYVDDVELRITETNHYSIALFRLSERILDRIAKFILKLKNRMKS